ncbi:MAG: beta-ketoacyl synthase N-terminal-like domain-containing protein, partial [Planctomycetaceae bacterium]
MNSADPTHPVPVAIIGMGCLFPKAEDLTSYWANIRNRLDAITEVPETHWRPEDYFDDDPKAPDRTYARRGGFLSPVDFPALEFGIAPHNLDATDTTQLLGLMVARQALEDAGYGPGRDFERDRVSVILGVTGTLELVIPLGARLGHPIWRRALEAAGVEETKAEEVVRRISGSYVDWQENSFPGLLGNVAAGRIANRLDLGGTNCVIDAACASSLGAVHLAMLELASGRCDLALTGGLDTFNDIFMYLCFSKTPALSPTGDARPFDADGDGTILGEGLGVLALKRRDDAIRDGDRIYAVIRGVGTSSDGKGNAVYAPSAAGQAEALRRAYAASGVSPDTIELVEAHGTGTKVGDATELAALGAVYREAKPEGTWCALGSVKSQIGHTKAAAGAAGLIKAALALHHKVLPPTIKVERPIEPAASGAAPFYINTESRPWLPRPDHPRRAAVSAFGFGGSNFHCVLEEADVSKAAIDWDGATQIVAFSAPSREALRAALDAWPRDLTWNALRAEAARARARFRVEEPVRLLLVVERAAADLARILDRAGALIASGPNRAVVGPSDGIYLGIGPKPGGLAMLFPGQGSQYVGMLRDLACQFPAMHDALAEADGAVGDDGPRPSDRIYPRPAFTESERARQEQALRATEVAQPALGAVNLGVLAILEHFGVRPDALAGHSFGELTALGASGRFDARALALLALGRGRLMARRAGDRGAMLAVLAPLDRVESALRDGGLDLVVANKNAPQQAVLSGPADEVARAAELFEGRGIATRRLDVSAAFHSRFVAEVREPFHEALRAVAFAPARLPVYANTTAARYPDDPDQARALLAGQLAQPVEFVAGVEAMYRSGLRTFLEVGPDAKLTGLVGAILDGREHAALAVDASRGRRGNVFDLARALAQLAALGHPVHLPGWDDAADARAATVRAPGLTVKICGANAKPKPRSAPTPVLEPPTAMTTTPPPDRFSQSHVPATNGDQAAHPGRNGTPSDHPRNSSSGTPNPVEPRPAIAPTPLIPPLPQGDPARLTQALRTIQENLIGLQKLGEQTARLHRQFLDGQDRTQHTFQALLEQQQRLMLASLGQEVAAPPSSPTPRAHPFPTRETASEPAAPRSSPPAAPAAQVSPPPPPPRAIPEPPAQAAAPAPAPPAPSAIECTQAALLDVVAEKTGYPAEMLEPDMQLDADLGIDSIKRVEILSALQERLPDAPVIK